jgi:5-deoxy-glucuronate isomerase
MSAENWHRPAGSLATSTDLVDLVPEQAGWTYSGLVVAELAPGEQRVLHTGPDEWAILPLGGSLVVEVEGRQFELEGRDDVFSRVTDWAYAPIDAEVRLTSAHGAEVAMPRARATRRFDPAYVPAGEVKVELRGAGPATRQVTNFMSPGYFDGADRLMCVELLTPDGNWSSYPPHRHDGVGDCLVDNEEIYYFRIGRTGSPGYAAEGFAMHRTYTVAGLHDELIDINVLVGDGDVFLIPEGYHGPCIAAPGYPLYYLNVLAGPGGERNMAFCDDPTHHWVRDSWSDMPPDPRCPMTSASGRVGS